MRAWRKLWWPPFPCWALLFALLLAALHSRPLVTAVAESLSEASGVKAIIKALITKESKEAVAETIQFTGYFLIAPLLFVNLIHDCRSGVLLTRRRLALTTFFWALLASIALALWKKTDLGFQGLFGSPNALSAFLAISVSLIAARLSFYGRAGLRGATLLSAIAILICFALVSSIWAGLALLIGIAVASYLTGTPRRSILITAGCCVAALGIWAIFPTPKLRADSMKISSAKESVKKQYVEWFVSSLRLADTRESSFATGAGPGNYQFNIGSYYGRLPNEEKMPPDSNNLYLVQAVNLGVLGLGVLLWVALHFGNLALDARRQFPTDWLSAGVLGALAAWVFVNIFHATIVRGTGIVFAFVLSLAVIASRYDWEPQYNAGQPLSDEEKRNFLDAGLS
jgi:hypothetical protein